MRIVRLKGYVNISLTRWLVEVGTTSTSTWFGRAFADQGVGTESINVSGSSPATITMDVRALDSQSNSDVANIATNALRNIVVLNSSVISNPRVFTIVGAVGASGSAGLGASGSAGIVGIGSGSGASGSAGISGPGSGTYTVVRGDTFSKIAQRFGLSINQLKALNPQVTNINVISVGQVLNVGGGSGSTTQPVITGFNPTTFNPVSGQLVNTGNQTGNMPLPSQTPKSGGGFQKFADSLGLTVGALSVLGVVVGVVVLGSRR